MNSKRLAPQNPNKIDSTFDRFQRANLLSSSTKSLTQPSRAEKISGVMASQFQAGEEVDSHLNDEINAEQASYLIRESALILSAPVVDSVTWTALTNFLSGELLEFIETKNFQREAEAECAELARKVEYAADPSRGGVAPNQVFMTSMALMEAKMRRDNLSARVNLVINELTREILAKLPRSSKLDELEIRLRGALSNLGA